MASIGRVWDCFYFSVDEVVLEIPALFEDILIVPIVLGESREHKKLVAVKLLSGALTLIVRRGLW
jgi:hypothetical protein